MGMGLDRHKQAEEYLSLANWAVVKTPDVGLDVRSQLHRNFGKLYASQGRHKEELTEPKREEGIEVLSRILEKRASYYGQEHLDVAEVHLSLGLLHETCGERLAAKEQLTLAIDLYERNLGANHETTMQAKEALTRALEMS